MHLQEIHYLTFDLHLRVNVTLNVAWYPLHHVTYSAKKLQVAKSNELGGDIFTKIHFLTFDLDTLVRDNLVC